MTRSPRIQDAYEAEWNGDSPTALKILYQLADEGNPEAQWALGQRCERGLRGLKKDEVAAKNWYRKAADQGFTLAMYSLGYQCEGGKQYAEAIEWYRKAAALGDQDAPYNLGNMYEEGRGVKQDYAEALKWFYKSAAERLPEALMKISEWYENGKYLNQDYVQAYAWLAVSNTQDIHVQEERLDALRTKMTPNQLAEAKKLIDGWKLPPIPTRE